MLARLALAMSFGAADVVAIAVSPHAVWAGSRDAEKAREDAQRSVEQAREQAQQAAERAREQAQQAADRSAAQATQRQQDDNRSQDASAAQRDQDSGQARYGTRDRDDGGKSPDQRGRGGRDDKGRDQDDDGPPKTLVDLIKRMAAPAQKGHMAYAGPHPELASAEILGVGVGPAAMARARALGFTIGHSSNLGQGHGRVTRFGAPPGLDIAAARDLLRAEFPGNQFGMNYAYSPYRYATGDRAQDVPRPQGVRRASIGGCDTQRCYGPAVIGWQPDLRTCTSNVRIGVIDTSVDLDHPAFKGRNVEVGNFLPKGATRAVNWHGTSVLAVLAGNPGSGTPGLVPDAHFFAADVYRTDESGQPVTDTLSLLRAIDWMGASRVSVVNMSLSGPDDELLQKAIADMSARGVLFVAAAGNGGPNAPPSYPAAYPHVVAVTAVDKDLRGYIHANHGDYIDIAAPGVGIWTALPDALEGYLSGTSFAAPHVTAILAATQGRVQDKSKEGYMRALAIRDLGPAGRDRIYGRGLALAPTTCVLEKDPGGWVTSVVGSPLPAASSGTISRPAAYK